MHPMLIVECSASLPLYWWLWRLCSIIRKHRAVALIGRLKLSSCAHGQLAQAVSRSVEQDGSPPMISSLAPCADSANHLLYFIVGLCAGLRYPPRSVEQDPRLAFQDNPATDTTE